MIRVQPSGPIERVEFWLKVSNALGSALKKESLPLAHDLFSGDKKQGVVALRRFVKVGDPTNKKRHLLKKSPTKECCDALISD